MQPMANDNPSLNVLMNLSCAKIMPKLALLVGDDAKALHDLDAGNSGILYWTRKKD